METVLNMISNSMSAVAPVALPITDDVPSNSQHQQLSETSAPHSAVKTEAINASPITQNISNSASSEVEAPAILTPSVSFDTTVCTATQSGDSSAQLKNSIEHISTCETSSNNGRIEQPLPQLQHLQQRNTGRTFFRAPGLEAPDESSGDFPTNALVCPDCGFSCSSKFHYNSHRNTHSTHQCPICKFETRTEGRLKKHMLQSHKREQRLAAGINIQSPPPTPTTLKQNSPPSSNDLGGDKCLTHQQILANHGISSDGINIFNSVLSSVGGGDNSANGTFALESLQSMLNNTNSTDAILKICTDAISSNGPNKKPFSPSPQVADLGHIPLEQLRALTERHSALLATSTTNSLNIADLQLGPEGSLIGSESNHQQSTTQQQSGEDKQGTPRRSGKPKQYKCKHCQHISRSKKEHWAHVRPHIPKQKQLTCSLCDFVTEYKHHLEYHYRNHNGQKPFKCSICDYTCVNKSMLNSHMKSHTPVYQFRCQDCTYQTKYCHSLKMHLKKYNHKRAPGPNGFVDSSDSHGEERPENASSSSIGHEDTAPFENGAPLGETLHSDGHAEGVTELIGALPPTVLQHHSLLNGPPPGDTAELELNSHRLMIQPQLEQMKGFIRSAIVRCPHCNFSTANIDEMNQHLLLHLIVTQQPMSTALNNEQHALASIYQRIAAQLNQELNPVGEGVAQPHQLISSPQPHHQNTAHSVLSRALASASTGSQQQQRGDDVPMELSLPLSITSQKDGEGGTRLIEPECIHQQLPQVEKHIHFTPTTMAEMLATVAHSSRNDVTASACIDTEMESARGTDGTSTTTPASNNNEQSNSSSTTQQMSYSPNSKSLKREFTFGVGNAFHSSNDGGSPMITQEPLDSGQSTVGGATGTCVITNVMPRLVDSISGLKNGFEVRTNAVEDEVSARSGSAYGGNVSGNFSGGVQGPSGIILPYFCQQCEIAFKDAALYQVHRGFHARENMFKCNICGHLSTSSLDFNLHLYQAKHE